MKCSLCGSEYEGKFCPNCGAKTDGGGVGNNSSQQNATGVNQTAFSTQNNSTKKKSRPFRRGGIIIILALLLIVVLFSVVRGKISGSKKDKKIDWSEIILASVLPEPPSLKGNIVLNTNEALILLIDVVTDAEYGDYLKACESKGFTVDVDNNAYSFEAYNSDGFNLNMSHAGNSLNINVEAPKKFGSITWPTGKAGKLLPAPKSTIGKFEFEHDDSFCVYIGETNCQPAHWDRCKRQIKIGKHAYPTVPYRRRPQDISGTTAHCYSFV